MHPTAWFRPETLRIRICVNGVPIERWRLLGVLRNRARQVRDEGIDCQRCGDVVPETAWARHVAEHLAENPR